MIDNPAAEAAFLNAVGAVLNDREPPVLPDGVAADEVFDIGSRLNMAPITYCALSMLSPMPASDRWGDYQRRFLDDCMRGEIQLTEYHKLVGYLCGRGVKIIPLKGCVMKELYPSPSLRVMADVDLLYEGVRPEDLAKLMEEIGYSTESLERGPHDVFHKKPCMNVELHRQLMADDSPYKPAFDRLFERAVPDGEITNLYHLTPEDLYIHEIAHAAKHFKSRQAHVRHVGDVYVLNRRYAGTWDAGYIRAQLDSVGLLRFEEKIRTIAYAFFGEEPVDVSDLDMELLFHGDVAKLPAAKGWQYMAKGGTSRLGFILGKTFCPYSVMCNLYPILRKCPILLPAAWLHRIVDVLLHRRQNIIAVANAKVNSEEADHVRRLLDNFGLGT